MADVPLQVISEYSQSERRITPSWTIGQLKTKLETVTGIPPSSQRLSLKRAGSESISIEAANEDGTHLSSFPLVPYAELHVSRGTLLICPNHLGRWEGTQERALREILAAHPPSCRCRIPARQLN